jgi:hypothetical protein
LKKKEFKAMAISLISALMNFTSSNVKIFQDHFLIEIFSILMVISSLTQELVELSFFIYKLQRLLKNVLAVICRVIVSL